MPARFVLITQTGTFVAHYKKMTFKREKYSKTMSVLDLLCTFNAFWI